LWMRDPIGPTMGEATANRRRRSLRERALADSKSQVWISF
jgi:hypothetical protein